ncbi:AAA family ATPase [Streptomyces sp. NPDC026672]|uniref:AAA family ATPase n=1 Tax=unclassified Streptomyces TaxID=2593676 RepID=UPI0033F8C975
MSGVDTVRGIAYQQAQAVLAAVGLLEDPTLGSIRVEGSDDAVDIELFNRDGTVRHAKQVKVRAPDYTWGETALLAVLKRWAVLPDAEHATFEFLTDGRLGPSGQRVQQALEEAAQGRTASLAQLLGTGVNDAVCVALGRASIRQDPYNTGALLVRAESQVAEMLPSARTEEDLRQQATGAVDRLFRSLFDYASNSDARLRIIDRQIIAALLGVPANQTPAQRWPTTKARYLEVAASLGDQCAITPIVSSLEGSSGENSQQSGDGDNRDVNQLLKGTGPVVLTGSTGTGKSTAVRILRQKSAAEGKAVIVVHAESYLPGRLAALAADGIASVLGEHYPTATGAQALSDTQVTFVIDGASEVAEPTRQALHLDLLASVASGHGARVVVVGRDVAALRSLLPSSALPAVYRIMPLDHERQVDLARETLTQGARSVEPDTAYAAVRSVCASLGDAARNPLLFSMAVTLHASESSRGRAGLYKAFIEKLVARSGATGISLVRTVLGIAFVRLLNEGRRYADLYEWHQILTDAAATLRKAGLIVDLKDIESAARRCGLITTLGWDQTVVAMHDSFADYLAGAAHGSGAAPLPSRLSAGDDQRILFCAELNGVDHVLAELVARDIPFTSVLLSSFDSRRLEKDAPELVASLLDKVSPVQGQTVALCRLSDDRVMAVRQPGHRRGWITQAQARELAQRFGAIVVDATAGPAAVAVRLWRKEMQALLRIPSAPTIRRPASGETACEVLAAHAKKTAEISRDLIERVAPPGHVDMLAAQVGPLGLHAIIGREENGPFGKFLPVSYGRASNILVRAESEPGRNSFSEGGSSTTLEYLLDKSPASAAAERVQKAIESLTIQGWLGM